MLATGMPPTAAAASPVPPQTRCTVTDPRLTELSGLVVVPAPPPGSGVDEVWAVDDGGRQVAVHRLDEDCAIAETRSAQIDPYDVEDLARGPDGAFWLADIGDNRRARETVAVIVLPAAATAGGGAAGEPRLHRLTYPDGPRDAEALLVDDAGVPHLVTKDVGAAGVYRPERALDGIGPPLVRVGEVVLPPSDTLGGPVGGVGSRVVTGAAVSVDGRAVALRTYTDVWLYPVRDGDLVTALREDPVRVPLPDEPQGEAVAFDRDGTLLAASEARGGRDGELRAVPGAAALVTAAPATAGAPPTAPPGVGASGTAAQTGAGSADRLPAAVGVGAATGVLLLGCLALALRSRRRRG